ncbi:MAG TPA: glycosyltransferase family 2 protein [Pseudobdellovibrionaceae bacterium]|jgi:glycosyltransferase involved in cell wall biosynthesis
MKFYYLVAAYNEERVLEKTVRELAVIPQRFPGSEILLLDNGSQDNTWALCQRLAQENSWVSAYHNDEKGMGTAFKRGLRELQNKNIPRDSWIVFCASDLPFGFSDLESFLELGPAAWQENILFVGSKRHSQSQVQRNWKRRFGSVIFELARFLILQIKTKDTQGSLFLRADQIALLQNLNSNDYFFTVELVYFAEKSGKVTEMPIKLRPEIRNSNISILKDGSKSLLQLLKFRQRL